MLKGNIDRKNNKVICPYHHKCFSEEENPDMWSGEIEHFGLWYGGDNKSDIPYIPEFDDISYRSVYITRYLKGVNAFSLFESNLDYDHVSKVHLVSFIERLSPKTMLNKSKNIQIHIYETDDIIIEIVNKFWIPFTNCLSFNITLKKNNKKLVPFILFFSMIPHDNYNTTVNIRFMRKSFSEYVHTTLLEENDGLYLKNIFYSVVDNIFDILSIGLIDIPLWEDAKVVKDISTKHFVSDNLDAEDNFIQHYRNRMFYDASKTIDFIMNK